MVVHSTKILASEEKATTIFSGTNSAVAFVSRPDLRGSLRFEWDEVRATGFLPCKRTHVGLYVTLSPR